MKNPLVPALAIAILAVFASVFTAISALREPLPERPERNVGKPQAWISEPLAPGSFPLLSPPPICLYRSFETARYLNRLQDHDHAQVLQRPDAERFYQFIDTNPARVWLLEERGSWSKVEVVYGESKGCIGWVESKIVVKVKPIKP